LIQKLKADQGQHICIFSCNDILSIISREYLYYRENESIKLYMIFIALKCPEALGHLSGCEQVQTSVYI
ncbi:MAG TPA: hypothetical protein VIM77_06815, partial [Mucilaginibacter sp.]